MVRIRGLPEARRAAAGRYLQHFNVNYTLLHLHTSFIIETCPLENMSY